MANKTSIDFNGNTGPFIQYTFARIQSVLRKATSPKDGLSGAAGLNDKELALIQRLMDYPAIVRQAGDEFSPAVICNYAYALACDFNSFYHDYSILNEPDANKRALIYTRTKVPKSTFNRQKYTFFLICANFFVLLQPKSIML